MKRIFFLIAVAATIGVSSLSHSGTSLVAASKDDFTIRSMDIEMNLGRDSNQHSTLETKQTIVADFPNKDVNHGITQIFHKRYDGHGTKFSLKSVTDENGTKLKHTWEGNELRIGDSKKYVNGLKTYVITYTQQDVTKYYADTKRQEFYWDVIGTEWRVPIERAGVKLSIDSSLQDAIVGQPSCYAGASGSTEQCSVLGTTRYVISERNLGEGSGMTLAIGLKPDTFAHYETPLGEKLFMFTGILLGITNGIGIIIAVIIGLRMRNIERRYSRTFARNQAIVPEYVPPKDRGIVESARTLTDSSVMRSKMLPAVLINLAVQGYIEIREVRKKSMVAAAQYDLVVKQSFRDANEFDAALAEYIFGSVPPVGTVIKTQNISSKAKQIANGIGVQLDRVRRDSGLFYPDLDAAKAYRRLMKTTTRIGFFTVSLPVLFMSLFMTDKIRTKRNPEKTTPYYLTETGANLQHYLNGLKLYIGSAEAERLRILQSPETAEKIDTFDPNDKGQLVHLYEKLLPYAMIFGQEKQWAQRLGALYAEANVTPDWTASSNIGAYDIAALTSFMTSFQGTIQSSSGVVSSSGGSTGGGSVGGGGGGGGGGGW